MSTDPGQENGSAGEAQKREASSSASACEPYREFIEVELAKGRNRTTVCGEHFWIELNLDANAGEKFSDQLSPSESTQLDGLDEELPTKALFPAVDPSSPADRTLPSSRDYCFASSPDREYSFHREIGSAERRGCCNSKA